MASVKTLHEIVTPDRLYPANTIIHDMPQTLIDEVRPLGAIEDVASEIDAAPAVPAVILAVKKSK